MEYSWDVRTLSLRTQSTLHSGVQDFSTALEENSCKVSTWHCRKAWAHAHRHMYTFSLTRSTHKHTYTTVFWRIYPCIQKINNSRKEKQLESQLIYLNHKMSGVVNEMCLELCDELSQLTLQGWDHSAGDISTQQVMHPPSSDCTCEGNRLRPARARQINGPVPPALPAFRTFMLICLVFLNHPCAKASFSNE